MSKVRAAVTLSALAIALSACATSPPVSSPPPPPGTTQALLLRTEPPGATCSMVQNGVVVASVDATPGIANLPRRNEPIEVVCRREGHLEQRMTIAAATAAEVKGDEPAVQERETGPPSGDVALGLLNFMSGGVGSPVSAGCRSRRSRDRGLARCDAELMSQLGQIPDLRARVRVNPP
jgi:hypothetical protein